MKQEEQSMAFAEDLEALINRYVDEFDLTYESFIGVLTITVHNLLNNQSQDHE